MENAKTAGTFYAILTVYNPYSSGSRGTEHGWYSNYDSEDMTRSEFTKVAKRVAKRKAEKMFYDTLKDGEKVKVFSSKEKFIAEYTKLTGATPIFNG